LSGVPGRATPPAGRLRVRYAKVGKIRFTSHRDVVRMWERALRRSALPVAWSGGFSPRPLLSFGHALPTGAESLAEYLDISLVPGTTVEDAGSDGDDPYRALAGRLSALLPDGVDVDAIAPLPPGSESLQQGVSSCSWKLEVFGLAAEELASRVERLLAAPTALVERERKGRSAPDDLRPAVLALAVAPRADGEPGEPVTHGDRAWLEAELATRPRGVRPRELLEVLGPGVRLSGACRMHQWIERDGTRVEPLVVRGREPGTVATHAEGRAS
jgi:radical SAM-linked protein